MCFQSAKIRPFYSGIANLSKIFLLITFIALISGCDTGTDTNPNDFKDINVYFSPADKCDEKVVALIDSAKEELHIAVYSFNRQPISLAVIDAHNRGVTVKVIFDEGQLTGPNSRHIDLNNAGVAIKKDKPTTYSLSQMHNKFAVIDNRIVITGSYNWTTNATNNNDENLIVVTSPSIAAAYNTEFNRIWEHAVDLTASDLTSP